METGTARELTLGRAGTKKRGDVKGETRKTRELIPAARPFSPVVSPTSAHNESIERRAERKE